MSAVDGHKTTTKRPLNQTKKQKINLKERRKQMKLYKVEGIIDLFTEDDLKALFYEMEEPEQPQTEEGFRDYLKAEIQNGTIREATQDEYTGAAFIEVFGKLNQEGKEKALDFIMKLLKDDQSGRDPIYYINRDTGETVTEEEARTFWRAEYDADDPTNILTFEDQYKKL